MKKPLIITIELDIALKQDNVLKNAFERFSLSYKREYADYISDAKREETRIKRLRKVIPMILENFGLNDKYKK